MESEDAEVMEDQISQEKMLTEDKDFGDETDYRTVIKEKFCVAWDKNSLTGESATLYQGIIQKDKKLLKNIFDTDINTYKMRQTVLFYGDAGVGKTTLLRRAMLEWADGNLFEKFAYVFYLSGREISQAKEQSFAQLISKNWPRSEVPIEQILSESRNLLFLIDSFDELDFSFEEPEFALCNDWTQEHPVSFLISSLLRKVMLPESFLLVTARSTARKKLMPLLHKPHCVELLGLSENARMDYIQHFFLNDKKWAKGVIYSIRKNPRLFKMCHVCQMCWVVCTCLKQQVEKGGDIAMTCQTTTSLFTCYVCSLFSRTDGSSVTLPNETLLRSLCQAAAEGIWTMKHILYKKNLRQHELTRNDISVFLDAKVLHEDTEYENCYTFAHLHVQEFFGALFYLLRENPEERDYPLKPFESLYLLLESNHSEDPHLEQMKCFLFGLMNKEQVRQLEETFNFTISMDVKGHLLMCLEAIEKDDSYPSQIRLLDLFHCLYETQDNDFITQALSSFPKIAVHVEEESQLLIYSFCFKHCYSLQTVKLTIKAELRDILDLDPTDETWLEACDVNVNRCQQLSKALERNNSLVFLNLSTNNLTNYGVKSLCKFFGNPYCCLERLSLASCGFTKDVCDILSFALNESRRLTHLCLADNLLGDEGIELLSDALKYPQCTLQSLVLRCCFFTPVGSEFLSTALLINRSLVHLDLGGNRLEDSGIKLLCHVLQQPTCTLEELE
ncbi:hypothetical protein ACRRTK_010730 [Alexandromys fortis]